MKKLSFVILLLALASVALPAAAKGHTPVGERIAIPGAPLPDGGYGAREFPADTPFHIGHGWNCENQPCNPGGMGFELDVDGEPVHWTYHIVEVYHDVPDCDGCDIKVWLYVTNFPEGMTGEHTFTGHWLVPCRDAEDYGLTCDNPGGSVEFLRGTLDVTFTE